MLEAGIYAAPAELAVGEDQASSCLAVLSPGASSGARQPHTCVLPGPDVPSEEAQQQPCLRRREHGSAGAVRAAFSSLQTSQRCQIPLQNVQHWCYATSDGDGEQPPVRAVPGCQRGCKGLQAGVGGPASQCPPTPVSCSQKHVGRAKEDRLSGCVELPAPRLRPPPDIIAPLGTAAPAPLGP